MLAAMTVESNSGRSLMGRIVDCWDRLLRNPGNDCIQAQFKPLEKEAKRFGVIGKSGRRYRDGDVVRHGRIEGGDQYRKSKEKLVAVFRIRTLSFYTRDGVPVEMVDRREVKSSQSFLFFHSRR